VRSLSVICSSLRPRRVPPANAAGARPSPGAATIRRQNSFGGLAGAVVGASGDQRAPAAVGCARPSGKAGQESRLWWRVCRPPWVQSRVALETGGTSALLLSLGVALLIITAGPALARPAPRDDPGMDAVEKEPLLPDEKLWNESLLWDKSVTLRSGFGYRDNVLWSPSSPLASPFYTGGLDLMLFRLPIDGLEFTLLVTGDDVNYWNNAVRGAGVKSEDVAMALTRVTKYFEGWRLGLELKGIYADQVMETLTDTGGVHAVEAKGFSVGAKPFARVDFCSNLYGQVEAPVSREWWESPLDDYWKIGGRALLGFNYGHHSAVTASYGGSYLPHDDWVARDETGLEISGKRLDVWRQQAELKWDHHWDAQNLWCSTTKLGFHYDRDNGGGYFNYYRYVFGEELSLHTKNWEIRGSGEISYYDFPVQTIDDTSTSKLHLTTLDLTLRIERRLYKTFRLFGQFEHEQCISNDSASEYKVNTIMGGLSYEF
jgi:hypothetical protein